MGYLNHLLTLPAMRDMMALPLADRLRIAAVLKDLRGQANEQAEKCWKKRKAPLAGYHRVVSTEARHIAHALTRGARRLADQPSPQGAGLGNVPVWPVPSHCPHCGTGLLAEPQETGMTASASADQQGRGGAAVFLATFEG